MGMEKKKENVICEKQGNIGRLRHSLICLFTTSLLERASLVYPVHPWRFLPCSLRVAGDCGGRSSLAS